ncbi:MAG: PIN domain-containing protein [Chloroflexi bacterium]|nr:MAG: PIN domain-containing protein [Chloroflexota bacterium]
MALLVLDTSVVVGWFDRNDALYDRATEALRRARMDEKVLPASAYAESMVLPNRLGPKAVAALDEALITLPVRIEPITADIARRAAVLRARHASLPLGDALVLACGEALGAIVLTGDRAWAKVGARVRLI